jgi:outer membrane protein OmpA-like peptidoglycan-associated protein
MHKGLKRTLALATLMAAGSGGAAHAMEGWYGQVSAGYAFDQELSVDNTDYDLDESHPLFASVGYAYDNGFRTELEGGWRTGSDSPFLLSSVDADVLSGMLNVFYDFNRGGVMQPYLGVGVGAARVDANGSFLFAGFDIDDVVLAYQGMAGVGIEVNDRLMLDIGYRYFETESADGSSFVFLTSSPSEGEFTQEAITIGLRASLGAPAAAAPPPPPPPPPVTALPPAAVACPTAEFVVYFEWDRSALNQAALETIDAAVARARDCNLGGVIVVGHTDTSGSPQYNVGLSERRAGVVRDALVARGIAADAVTTEARGESDLARATQDGVREPLNRRTAVTISFR